VRRRGSVMGVRRPAHADAQAWQYPQNGPSQPIRPPAMPLLQVAGCANLYPGIRAGQISRLIEHQVHRPLLIRAGRPFWPYRSCRLGCQQRRLGSAMQRQPRGPKFTAVCRPMSCCPADPHEGEMRTGRGMSATLRRTRSVVPSRPARGLRTLETRLRSGRMAGIMGDDSPVRLRRASQ